MKQIIKFSIYIVATISAGQAMGNSAAAPSSGTSTNTALIPVQKLEQDFYNWQQRHDQVIELAEKRPVDLIFIGDSITHMFGGEPTAQIARGSKTWGHYYGHRNPLNMGFGWDRTQNVLWRLTNGELEGITPKVAVVLIGTNNRAGTKNARQNTPSEIAEGVTAICKTIHKKTPECKILLLGLLPRSPGHFAEPIQEVNQILAPLDKEDYITFLNMHDGVHPNAAGYQVWAETMEPILSRMLDDETVMPTNTDTK
jgi:lysophospholipase L1-like esterase